jgi:hypothetical protein
MLIYMKRVFVLLRENKAKTTRPSVLLSDLVLPARIPSNSSRNNGNYRGYNGGRTMKDNRIQNSLKVETPEKPEGCTIMSEITEEPARLLYRNTRQFSFFVP